MSDQVNKKTPKTKRTSTPAEREAGRANLLAFRAKCGGRPALRHGVRSLLSSGSIPEGIPDAVEIERAVSDVIDSLVSDLGGSENVTAAQRVIISGLRLSLLVQALCEDHIKRSGIVNRRSKRANPLLGIACTYINSARLAAQALGFDRVARKIGPSTLAEYLEQRPASVPETDGAEG